VRQSQKRGLVRQAGGIGQTPRVSPDYRCTARLRLQIFDSRKSAVYHETAAAASAACVPSERKCRQVDVSAREDDAKFRRSAVGSGGQVELGDGSRPE
jgi:hypothetical protein